MTRKPSIGHIGIVVDALEPAILAWRRVLPGAPVTRHSMPDVGLEVAVFDAANLKIELLQYVSSERSFAREVMGNATGVNHIAIATPDIDAAIARFAAEGLDPQQGFPRPGAEGQVAFMCSDPRLHVLVELCEPKQAANLTESHHAEHH